MEHPYPDLPDIPPLPLLIPAFQPTISNQQYPAPQAAAQHWRIAAQQTLIDGLRVLRTDHSSGAKELATNAVTTLVRVAEIVGEGLVGEVKAGRDGPALKEEKEEEWWDITRRAGWVMATYGRPSMGAAVTAAIVKGLDRRYLGLRQVLLGEGSRGAGLAVQTGSTKLRNDDDDGKEVVLSAMRNLQSYLRQRVEGVQSQVGVQLRNFLRRKFCRDTDKHSAGQKRVVNILTLSSSSTIRRALITMLQMECKQQEEQSAGERLAVHLKIMESRPLCEGVALARALVSGAETLGYKDYLSIEIASDASVALLARDVDVVLLGADRITDKGDVSNKTGSLAATLCAKGLSDNVTIVAVSELEKVAKPGTMEEHVEEDNDVSELVVAWGDQVDEEIRSEMWQAMVSIRNVYFEWVPAGYIDHYICETGILDVKGISEQSQRVLELEQQAFGGLSTPTK
ncbi:hypothetical protein AJ80_01115 [Polytolypa hystricis UAMH7299]|uniref:Nagb/rpia/CoA transferase-like protein n=1 Tax=Polytolypa hystricis (strain UAMH7299) TaxID=1447883 RepID=A0A2B7Z202_POLH7|nr:hypothetical protein AJ80_01115 [Polytolypa hystricis UAMH7299]